MLRLGPIVLQMGPWPAQGRSLEHDVAKTEVLTGDLVLTTATAYEKVTHVIEVCTSQSVELLAYRGWFGGLG